VVDVMTRSTPDLSGLHILAVDGEESNLALLRGSLQDAGYTNVEATTDPGAIPGLGGESRPVLLLLDVQMPEVDGLQVLARVAARGGTSVLALLADATEEAKGRVLTAGASDFVTKPVDRVELPLRVTNLLRMRQLQERRAQDLEAARLGMLDRLALAAEDRDDDTQEHAWRIGRTSGLLSRALGLSIPGSELIERAAPLHDIGKIGIPDSILLKPGPLTSEEFEAIKTHTTIGAQILSGERTPLLRLAEQIALTHHERWDGRGYPGALGDKDIPLAGRIVAVADVFDALTHDRPYKDAWPVEQAVGEICRESGRQFDPDVVEAFSRLDHAGMVSPQASYRAQGPVPTGPRARDSAPRTMSFGTP
jgi:putative two-component system response regulator